MDLSHYFRVGLAALAALTLLLPAAVAQTLVPSQSTWRYVKGTSEASDPISAWRTPGFADSRWPTGPAPFHFGDGLTQGTHLDDMRGLYTCVFLRHTFAITNLAAIRSLELSVDYDDGFVAWINGTETARSGVAGDPVYTDIATLSHEAGSPVVFTPPGAPSQYLVEGQNVLAIQAFNRSLSASTDFRIDAGLSATLGDDSPPTIVSRSPSGTTLGSLTEIVVVFSKPVVGVQAQDLLLNDRPAAALTTGPGSATCTFTFTQPPPGLVSVSWSEANEITDTQGNDFNTEAPDATWSYELADTAAPQVLESTPATSATVRQLTGVELLFNEPVLGVDAADLLVNGQPSTHVTGLETGPYRFAFPTPASGQVQLSWAVGHGITDASPAANAFAGPAWSVNLDPDLPQGDLLLHELVAVNLNGLTDEDGQVQDWIELHNRGTQSVSLLGWSLTDDPGAPGRWVFPARSLAPGAYLVVFASGKDRRPVAGSQPLHTNFRLGAFGEYLGLYNAEYPREVVAELAPGFPEQRAGYAYGLNSAGTWHYLNPPTPGAPNAVASLVGIAPKPHFSVGRGLFEAPFQVLLTTPLAEATIRYTTDGSEPSLTYGSTYASPIAIDQTTTLRAATFNHGHLPSRIGTMTYLFLDTVSGQPTLPDGFPSTWGTKSGFTNNLVPADYEMDLDPLRVDPNNPASSIDPQKARRLRDGLRDLPVVSVVMARNDMFGPGGLYPTSSDANKTPNEKPCSVEMIRPDGTTAFAIDGGLDLHGNASRNPLKNPKHGFKLTFKKEFGPTTLNAALFPDSPARVFDDLLLRPDFNTSWRHWSDAPGNGNGAYQRSRGTRTRYAWSHETFREMGNVSCHTLYFHLFINGLYWGVYDFGEQPTDKFAEAYFGGPATGFDIYDQGSLRQGTSTAYNTMLGIGNLADHTNYERMKQWLDVPQFIDYMLLHFYVGHQDWGNAKNWYAIRPRIQGPAGTFKYVPWDQECILLEENVNRVPNGGGGTDVPSGLHTKLDDNAQYRLDFADRIHRHLLTPGGVLTPEANIARWQKWQAALDRAIVAESCRWGDYRRDVHPYSDGSYQLYTREQHWLAENRRLVDSYFVNRGAIVLGQLRAAGLYPAINPPQFNPPGGQVNTAFNLTLQAPSGTIYYTTNGTDPRVYGSGSVSAHALTYASPIPVTSAVTVQARALSGATWSALNTASFSVGELGVPLRFTEIMYHPTGGDAQEFLELQNLGLLPLDVSGYSLQGCDFIFPQNTVLPAGAIAVLSSSTDTNAFRARYPSVSVLGAFGGQLNNGGERLAIVDRQGRTVTAVHYDDEDGWPPEADGLGASLEILDPRGDPNDPANWQASTTTGGSPGLPTAPPEPPEIALNEIMADNLSAVPHAGGYPDWVELHNPGTLTVNLAGWSLTDTGDPRRFVFPGGTTLLPGGYLVVWCADPTPGAPGLFAGFALGRRGERLALYDAETNRVDAVSFGLQVPNRTVGLVNGDWQLTLPTPGQPNIVAALAPPEALTINEWLTHPGPGGSAWLELFNASADAPAALRGLYVGTSQDLARIESLAFVPPLDFIQLFADQLPGQDHLEFTPPPADDAIILYDTTGLEFERVTYGLQTVGVSQGRLPDGAGAIVAFPQSPTPAASNYLPSHSGPWLNEILARNRRATISPWGNATDWIELNHPGPGTAELGGMTLARGTRPADAWTFPDGTLLPAGQQLVVWCDGSRPASVDAVEVLNSGFSLDGSSGDILLFNAAGQLVDQVGYGFQLLDLSIGREGSVWRLLASPTPGTPNAPALELGPVNTLRINEWMANPRVGSDWFEIYNPDPRPVDLAGLFLSDQPSTSGSTNTQIAPLSFIDGRRWITWIADGNPAEGRDHVGFRLNQEGETIRLYTPHQVLIDAVDFGRQQPGISQGRLPDGAPGLVEFSESPTPGEANYLPLPSIVINEVLTHTDTPFEDAIELHNLGPDPVELGGWYLSDSTADPKRYRIPNGTSLAPDAYQVFYQAQFGPDQDHEDAPPWFSLNSAHGDTVVLAEADVAGNLTGRRAVQRFGPAANATSIGRHVTSAGVDFVALSARTFGADNPASVAEFRTGAGLPNAYPLVGPVVIQEIMFHPPTDLDDEAASGGEFIELFNPTDQAVLLYDLEHPDHRWRLANAVSFEFPPDTTIGPGQLLVVVPFDPTSDPTALATFHAAYGADADLVGPFSGRLDNQGERLELLRPDTPQTASAPDAGFIPYLLVEAVSYLPTAPWPAQAAGTGASLQRLAATDYGNDPVNWTAALPTPGRLLPTGDRDADGLPDDWEILHGTDPDVPDADADPDQDGMTNREEYLAGTDPSSDTSVLRLIPVALEAGQVTFEFEAIAHRTYTLLCRNQIAEGPWKKVLDVPAPTLNQVTTLSDPAPAPNGRFYRLVTPAIP